MPAPLAGQVVLITGAAQGIGRGIAEVLTTDGAQTVLADRDEKALTATAATLTQAGHNVLPILTDITSPQDVEAVVSAALTHYGHIDALVNNAGIVKVAPFTAQTQTDWHQITQVNLLGTAQITAEVIPHLRRQRRGSIVTISSIAALGYTTSHAPYAATKSALIAMTTELAAELATDNIRANTILPGYIKTALSTKVAKSNTHLPTTPREPPKTAGAPQKT